MIVLERKSGDYMLRNTHGGAYYARNRSARFPRRYLLDRRDIGINSRADTSNARHFSARNLNSFDKIIRVA